MTDLTSQFAADAALDPPDPTVDAARLSTYVGDLIATEARIETLEASLKEAEAESRRLREVALPELMDRLRLKQVTGADGSKISVGTVVRASLPKDPDDGPPSELRAEGLAWLRARHAGAVKHQLIADLGKGAGNQAEELAEFIKMRVPSALVSHGEGVHHTTLAAIVRAEIEAGGSPPLDALGAYVSRAVKITKAKV